MQETTIDRLFKTRSRRPARQFMGLNRGIKSKKLRFKILVMLSLRTQFIRGINNRLSVYTQCVVSIFIQRIDDRQYRGGAVEPGEGMICRIHNLRPVSHRFNDPSHIIPIRIVAVVVDNEIRIPVQDGFCQVSNPLRGSQTSSPVTSSISPTF